LSEREQLEAMAANQAERERALHVADIVADGFAV
jgi:hypothetical protein